MWGLASQHLSVAHRTLGTKYEYGRSFVRVSYVHVSPNAACMCCVSLCMIIIAHTGKHKQEQAQTGTDTQPAKRALVQPARYQLRSHSQTARRKRPAQETV